MHTCCDPYGIMLCCVCVTLASYCFHQSQLWSLSTGMGFGDVSERRICHSFSPGREKKHVLLFRYHVMTVFGFLGRTHEFRKHEHRATGPCLYTVWNPAQEAGNYPRFTSWLAGRDYKRIVCFFLHGNKLIQTRCIETQWGTEVASQFGVCLSANVSMSVQGEGDFAVAQLDQGPSTN